MKVVRKYGMEDVWAFVSNSSTAIDWFTNERDSAVVVQLYAVIF